MTQHLAARIAAIVGPNGLFTEPADIEPYLTETRGLFKGRAAMVVRPASTEQVARVVALCAEAGVAIVPQGGNTGLCGGASPDPSGAQVILNLQRMNRVRAVDPGNFTMTVEAGVALQTVQEKALEIGCCFPLSMGSEGSCQIGGNISTNAGGSGVLRYGNTRDLVMGLEVVLPDGRVWNGLKGLRKDNTGYDLKQLFVGAEGTLGVVTAAVLKLFPAPRDVQTAFCALSGLDAALPLLARARAASGDQVTAFELMPRITVDLTATLTPNVTDPFPEAHQWYALIELSTSRPDGQLRENLESFLAAAIEEGEVADAVVASSLEQRKGLWRIREHIPEAQIRAGGSIKHDISVPVTSIPDFIRRGTAAAEAAMPGVRVVGYGHAGDGNLHFNLSQPVDADKDWFMAQYDRMNKVIHDIVAEMNGSISAEHGIGQLKREELTHYKPALDLELMRRIKAALDPRGIMNPGKVV